MFTVALVGSDGSGKTTITRRVGTSMPFPVKTMYMGVNLEMNEAMLPTTRFALELKRALGRRPDMVAASSGVTAAPARRRSGGAAAGIKSVVKIANWVAEEWFRQLLAWYHSKLRGRVVLFDRHFFADYYAYDVAVKPRRTMSRRLHGFILANLYPKPDLVIYLDAPAEVLFERKGEGTLESLERRRREYLELGEVLDGFAVVDANRPLEAVTRDVAGAIESYSQTGRRALRKQVDS